jgi:hypothetical protein
MKVEIVKPTPEVAAFQSLFNQTDKETISLLMEEVEELYAKLEEWEKCADRLFVYAEELLSTARNRALYEIACEDVAEYKRLKNEAKSNE